ncbi:ABC transporter substrate-binding protein [Aestuariimicrobium soli]|uniref:ABC transporter substrate-binding protein n=1 Tax=Aestuariimicrobium soli TaxID=2035834 RepID=UPI003EC09CCC
MFRTLRTRAAAVVAIAVVMGVAACTPPPDSSGSPSPTTGSSGSTSTGADGSNATINVWMSQKPDSMSPLTPASYGNASVYEITQDVLAAPDNDGKLVPRVAESWQMADDAKTLTIKLATQKWSDGQEMTADDVVFSLNLYGNPDVKAPVGTIMSPIVGYDDYAAGKADSISGVKKVDDRTVTISLKEPNSNFTYQFFGAQFYVLPKHTLENEDMTKVATSSIWTTPGKVPGLGPVVLTGYQQDQRVEFERNDNYRKPVKFKKLVQSMVTQDVATQQLASGEIDLTSVLPTDIKTVEGMKGVKTVEVLSTGFDRYSMPQTKDYLKNPKVRQGLLTAIDRAGIIASIYGGAAEPQNSAFLASYITTDGFNTYEHDPAKAKQLLTEGGWDFNRELKIYQASGNAQREAVNAVVLQNFKEVGVKAKIVPYDQAQGTDVLTKKDYDMMLFGGGNYLIDASQDGPILSCATAFPAGANLPGYCNPELDKAMTEASKTADEAKRAEFFNQAAKLENNDVSYVWIARPKRVYAFSSKLGNVTPGEGLPDALRWMENWTVNG